MIERQYTTGKQGIFSNEVHGVKADVVTLSRVPLAPVESALSLPAKSTRLILLTY